MENYDQELYTILYYIINLTSNVLVNIFKLCTGYIYVSLVTLRWNKIINTNRIDKGHDRSIALVRTIIIIIVCPQRAG